MSDLDDTQPASAPTPEPASSTAVVSSTRPWYRRTGALIGGGVVAGVLLVAMGGAVGSAITQGLDDRRGDRAEFVADGQGGAPDGPWDEHGDPPGMAPAVPESPDGPVPVPPMPGAPQGPGAKGDAPQLPPMPEQGRGDHGRGDHGRGGHERGGLGDPDGDGPQWGDDTDGRDGAWGDDDGGQAPPMPGDPRA